MAKCRRCRTEILDGQLVCPSCGLPLRAPRRVRCRHCKVVSSRGLTVCPACGERLQRDWVRPVLISLAIVTGIVLVVVAGPRLRYVWERIDPAAALSRARAAVAKVKIPISVPSVTPSLTPSVTPTPTRTPTVTPWPSLTPTPTQTATPSPTLTPTLTSTPTPSPTRRRAAQTAKPPTSTATPTPNLPAPTPAQPEDGATFLGSSAIVMLIWNSTHALGPDEFFLATLRYVRSGTEIQIPIYSQDAHVTITSEQYLQADQETNRAYWWTVRIVRRTTDPAGNNVYVPLSPPSEERVFHWW